MTEWIHKAACRQHETPNWWTPLNSDDPATEALRICHKECPVRLACAEWALRSGERDVVAGGYRTWDEEDLEKLSKELPHIAAQVKRAKRRSFVCADCGETFQTTRPSTRCSPCRQGLVPAGPVRESLLMLRKLMSTDEIGASTGVAPTTLSGIVSKSNPPKWVKAVTAQRVMAFRVAMEVSA